MKLPTLTAFLMTAALASAALAQPLLNPPATIPADTDAAPAATTQTYQTVTLRLEVIQGTKDGPAIANVPAVVELMHRVAPIKKYDITFDAKGQAVIPNIPITVPVDPVVILNHADLEQEASGPTLDGTAPEVKFQLRAFETTDQPPEWTVAMRHAIVNSTSTGLKITEMLAIDNPSDRVWLGRKMADDNVTIAIPIPPGASEVELLDGFGENTKSLENRLINTLPLFPGSTKFSFSYTLPVTDHQLTLALIAPAATATTMVILPADDSKVEVQGLESMGTMDMGKGNMRAYKGGPMKTGEIASLKITGITLPPSSAADGASSNLARNTAIIGIGVLVLAGFSMMMFKRPKSAAAK